jgi:hypothetical protein
MATQTQAPITSSQKAFIASETARLERLRKTREKYVITDKYLGFLRKCEGKKQILFVIDNSESMRQPSTRSPSADPLAVVLTKWYDLQTNLATALVDVSALVDRDGIDVCFINSVHPDLVDLETGGTTVRNIVSSQQLDPYFQSEPHGSTPLEHVLQIAIERKLRSMDAGQDLIVIVATDGKPTKLDSHGVPYEDINGFKKMLKNRPYKSRVFISLVACTDDPSEIGYLSECDNEIEGCDSTGSYFKELAEVKKRKGSGFDFGYGVYIVKIICGSFEKELDLMDKKHWWSSK